MIRFPGSLSKNAGQSARLLQPTDGRGGSLPDLKTTKAFQDFQAQIEGTENRINVARQDYNKAIEEYNLKVRRFPNNIFRRHIRL